MLLIILPNRPPLLRRPTQLPLRKLLQPALLPPDRPHPPIRLPLIPAKQGMPMLQALLDLLPRTPQLRRMPILLLRGAQRLPRLGLGPVLVRRRVLGLGVDGHVHLLDAAQVRHRVVCETARQERARRVVAREEVVAPSRPVGGRRGGDVVDCAVEREVDGLCGVGAVVGEELGVCEVDFSLL